MAAALALNELLEGCAAPGAGIPALPVMNLVLDSRKVEPGDVFVALTGESTDGLRFVDSAITNGASAVLLDASAQALKSRAVPVIHVERLKQKLPGLADKLHADPSAGLILIAITGTNGKTTCAHLIAQALKRLSVPAAVIGTAGQGMIGELSATSLTTPDVVELRRLLAEFRDAGAQAVVFEASSHGLEQGRLDGLKLDIAVFTNLSHDHLDYHLDFDAYTAAKLKLFQFPSLAHAVMNADHPLVDDFKDCTSAGNVWTYGRDESANVRLVQARSLPDGLALDVAVQHHTYRFESRLVGRINIENLLAVFTTLVAYGHDPLRICEILPGLESVPGRMEVFGGAGSQPMVVVDYAHTPDSLEKALKSLKDHVQGRLVCVFGCGGDRDRLKRPRMGAACDAHADVCVVTDDNPRHERSQDIIADILAGMARKPMTISERPEAIRWAIGQANSADVVLVAGKGHETTQQVGDAFIPMSDRELVAQALEDRV